MPNYNLLDLMEKAVGGEDILKVQDDRNSLLDVAYQAVMEEVRRRVRAEVERTVEPVIENIVEDVCRDLSGEIILGRDVRTARDVVDVIVSTKRKDHE